MGRSLKQIKGKQINAEYSVQHITICTQKQKKKSLVCTCIKKSLKDVQAPRNSDQ